MLLRCEEMDLLPKLAAFLSENALSPCYFLSASQLAAKETIAAVIGGSVGIDLSDADYTSYESALSYLESANDQLQQLAKIRTRLVYAPTDIPTSVADALSAAGYRLWQERIDATILVSQSTTRFAYSTKSRIEADFQTTSLLMSISSATIEKLEYATSYLLRNGHTFLSVNETTTPINNQTEE